MPIGAPVLVELTRVGDRNNWLDIRILFYSVMFILVYISFMILMGTNNDTHRVTFRGRRDERPQMQPRWPIKHSSTAV